MTPRPRTIIVLRLFASSATATDDTYQADIFSLVKAVHNQNKSKSLLKNAFTPPFYTFFSHNPILPFSKSHLGDRPFSLSTCT